MGKFLALPANARLGWKWLTVANTLAYDGSNYHVRYLSTLLYKPDPKLRSTPFKDGATLVPKLDAPLFFWRSVSPPPLNTGSSILDPDRLIFCTI
jgi:hypothetical protein